MSPAIPLSPSAEVVVVGGGVVGLSTAVALQDAGADVICLESNRPGQGQSLGPGRLFRHLHARPELIDFAVETRELWDAWSISYGEPLIDATSALFTIPDAPAQAARLERHGVEVAVVRPASQVERFSAFSGSSKVALLDVNAGVFRTSHVIAALQRRLGDRLHRATAVGFDSTAADDAVVATDRGAITCDQVVVAAGTATAALVAPVGIDLALELRAHVRATFALRSPVGAAMAWSDELGEFGEPVYGGPLGDEGRFFLGLNGVGRDTLIATPDDPAMTRANSADLRALQEVAARALPGVDPAIRASTTCVTTSFRSGGDDFGLATSGRIHAFAGNNVYKFAPGIGLRIADAVREGHLHPLLRQART